jgi:hypothetical protein
VSQQCWHELGSLPFPFSVSYFPADTSVLLRFADIPSGSQRATRRPWSVSVMGMETFTLAPTWTCLKTPSGQGSDGSPKGYLSQPMEVMEGFLEEGNSDVSELAKEK